MTFGLEPVCAAVAMRVVITGKDADINCHRMIGVAVDPVFR